MRFENSIAQLTQSKPLDLVVVLGMHRSGTSAVTRALKTLGVELGDQLLPAAAANERGFWEDLDVNALNIEMLERLATDWHFLQTITTQQVEQLCQTGYLARAGEILRNKVAQAGLFGFKDPRVVRLLPFWKRAFSHCGYRVAYVLPIRNPRSVSESLATHHGIAAQKSYLLWLAHVIVSLAETAGERRVLINYDALVQAPDREIGRVSTSLGLGAVATELEIYKSNFLDVKLRHNRHEPSDLDSDNACPPLAREVYTCLLDVATDHLDENSAAFLEQSRLWYTELERMQVPLSLIDSLEQQVLALTRSLAEREGQAVSLNQAVCERDKQVAALNEAVVERGKQVASAMRSLADRDGQLASLHQAIAERDGQIATLNQGIQCLHNSTSWRITSPVRWIGYLVKRINRVTKLASSAIEVGGGLKRTLSKVWYIYQNEGFVGIRRGLTTVQTIAHTRAIVDAEGSDRNDYQAWIKRYDTLSDSSRRYMAERIKTFWVMPKISILMPVYDPPVEFLDNAIASVRKQIYPNWELCVADDASQKGAVRNLLKRCAAQDERIKVAFRTSNGHISAASNSALELATGEYIALLDHDDELAEHALFWVAQAIQDHPSAGLIYSDEDKIDADRRRYDPYFKCDLNPELLLAQNMICHLGVYRTDLVRELEGFRTGFEGAQDYDLALRVTERLGRDEIVHIPRVLYHWRAIKGSTALSASEKNYAADAGRRAVLTHLQRTGKKGKVVPAPGVPGFNRVVFEKGETPWRVSIVIPTRDRADLLGLCLSSILERTTYRNYEIIIVDNGSVEASTFELFARAPKDRVRVLRDEAPFNFSRLNNRAARQARGELLCLVNNDIEIQTGNWLEEMLSFAIQPEIGCVGARLWYPDGRLQHGGVVVGLGGVAGHSHKYLTRGGVGYFYRAALHQSYSAVTAACLMVRREVFERVGGFDETLEVAFNDVDFCLRVRQAGYRNVWTPYAEMIHHESASRGYDDNPEKQERFADEVGRMQSSWGEELLNDPAYSPNLTLDREDFSLAWPPRVRLL